MYKERTFWVAFNIFKEKSVKVERRVNVLLESMPIDSSIKSIEDKLINNHFKITEEGD